MAVVVLTMAMGSCTTPDGGAAAHRGIRTLERGAVYAGVATELDQLAGVDALGIRTLLDLDQESWADRARVSRDHAMARERGVLFVHLPLDPVTAPSLAELKAAVDILREPRFHPILVHADHGDHRIRMVIAAYRVRVQGWTPARASEEMAEGSRRTLLPPAWSTRLNEYAAVHGINAPGTEP
jgi:hypothetical protein